MVKLKQNETQDFKSYHVIVNQEIPERNVYLVSVKPTENYSEVLTKLKNDPKVEIAEPNYIKKITALHDEYSQSQWYLPTLQLPDAWSITKGSPNTVVAVLDSGIRNSTDIKNVFQGADFVDNDYSPNDLNGHGTFVSTILAASHNDEGIAGISPETSILPVKVADYAGNVSTYSEYDGIQYAMDQGADIINMSFGGYYYSEMMENLIWEAHEAGIVLVAAAGNESSDDEYYPSYPATYPGVISVSATNESNQRSWFSNYGYSVDVAAPGSNIMSMDNYGRYGTGNGTSFSAPIISGIASLLHGRNNSWTPDEIEYALEKSAKNYNGFRWNEDLGYGIANAYKAITTKIPARKNDNPQYLNEATVLKHGETIKEPLQLPLDLDTYKFQVKNQSETRIDIANLEDHMDVIGLLLKDNLDGTYTQVDVIDAGYRGDAESYNFSASPGTYYLVVTEYDDQWSDQSYHLDLTITPQAPERIYGLNRYETAIEISKQGWGTSDTVILATSLNFPDALAGAPLAYQMDAPILLTNKDKLTEVTRNEIISLGAQKVILLGGESAIAKSIETELKDLGVQIQRINGENRYDTAGKIADLIKKQSPQTINKAVIANGNNFPDALTVASYAARNGIPILLSQTERIPEATKQALHGVSETIVVGGEMAIGDAVFDELPMPDRVSGNNRFETTASIINELGLPKDKMFITTGFNFADALTGSVLAAKWNRPIVLVKQDDIPAPTSELINANQVNDFIILGGPAAVSVNTGLDLLR
ncbi:cell wall-binding repeat-containing protein [Virgibacillus flavescens]|uniref:cell wall-binding repeat-containing protein n=1 Tax=Virgibacillus flavescens TaxID=1611422 RepID=UPI003D3460AB